MIKLGRAPVEIKRSKRLLLAVLFMAAASVFLLSATLAVKAQAPDPAGQNYGLTPGEGIGEVAIGQERGLMSIVAQVINIVLGFLGVVAVGLILYAGFLWMTAHGNEDQVKKAKILLRNAAIGLAIILSAWGIAAFVIRQLSNATGGGSGGGGDGGGGIGGGLPAERFALQEFQTGHAGRTNRDDVFRCSAVQARFNHWLDNTSVAGERANLKALITGADSTHDGNYQPVTESQMAVDINSSGNVIAYRRAAADSASERVNWPPYSQIEIRVPKGITDSSDKPLVDCTALGCNDRADHYAWTFTTTDKTDVINPSLTSSFPPMPGSREGYPNRNVDRSVTFTLNFSEAIDFFSAVRADGRLIPERVRLEQITSATDFTARATIPTEHLDASLSETGIRFSLNRSHQSSLNDGPYLEPFTWYRLVVSGVTDLCGNPLSGGTIGIVFQTNGNIPGLEFTYPSDGYEYACPNTETFVQFRTSMYDVRTSSCIVSPGSGGLVLSGSGIAGRNLIVRDNVPPSAEGVEINPNNFCKRYDFSPQTAELVPDTTYNPSVDYRNPANDSQTAAASWSFDVKEASACANAPYISQISPNQGPWGRCLTIDGNYFGPAASRAGSDAFAHLDLDSPRNLIPSGGVGDRIRGNWTRAYNSGNGFAFGIQNSSWQDAYLTGQMPNIRAFQNSQEGSSPISLLPPARDGILDFEISVTRNVTLGGQSQALKSNIVNFAVPDSDPPYAGPCLANISPTSGAWSSPVTLSGTRFGAGAGGSSNVTFTNRVYSASVSSWQDERIQASVPNESQDGLVHVVTDQGVSNGLPFDVANGRGGSCSADRDCAPPLVCSDGICADPVADTRPAGFRVEAVWPAASCANTCTNAAVGLETNLEVNRTTVQTAVFNSEGVRVRGSLAVRRCQNQNCSTFASPQSESFTSPPDADSKRITLQFPLSRSTSYRLIVFGGPSGLLAQDGKELATLNYDSDGNGSNDAYSWYFTTGTNVCSVSRVEMDKPRVGLYESESSNLTARPYARPDSCSPQDGQLLDPSVLTGISWRACAYSVGNLSEECSRSCPAPLSGSAPTMIVNSSTTVGNVVTARTGSTSGNLGLACMFVGGNEIKGGSVVIVRSRCREDSDCVVGSRCLGSICNRTGANAGRCTPVINSIAPSSGRAGTWVTINGCYFGNQPGSVTSATTNVPFEVPSASCGQVWNDSSIITESPAALSAAEAIKITKHASEDGQNAVSSANFTPNSSVYPALCRVRPDYGSPRSEIKLFGKNFGSRNLATDRVVFSRGAELTEALTIREWSDTASSTMITLLVPTVGTNGDWDIRVKKNERFSNPVNFNVIGAGGAPPSIEDLRAIAYTPGASGRACPAMVVEVVLSGRLDLNSVLTGVVTPTAPNNFSVRRQGEAAPLPGSVLVRDLDGLNTRLSFMPASELSFGASYSIILRSGDGGLRSQSGGHLAESSLCNGEILARSSECAINFSVIPQNDAPALAQCQPAGLSLDPVDPLYTCAGKNDCPGDASVSTPGNQSQFLARLAAQNGQPLRTSGSAYTWTSGDETVLSFQPVVGTAQTQTFTVNPKNGITRIGAEVTLSGKKFSSATRAQVFLCANPWPAFPRTPFKDVSGAGFTTLGLWSNFSTFYCRDRGDPGDDDDLPALGEAREFTAREGVPVQDFVKEIFLTQPFSKKCQGGSRDKAHCAVERDCGEGGACVGKTDAIGIRVLRNPDHDSTAEWYSRQSFAQGSPQSLKVDGYDAARDGRTVYVNAVNDSNGETGAGRGTIFTNIYLISINDQAQPDTQNIFEQLVANWRFAANVHDSDNLDKLRRDTKRLADIRGLADLVETYAAQTSSPPKIDSGSFTKYLSVSVWPSWVNTLGVDLGAGLPVDPLNTVVGDACTRQGAAADTCWNPNDKLFKCVDDSFIYQYEYTDAASPNFILRANLEYQPYSWFMPSGSRWHLTGAANSCQNVRYGVNR